MRLKRRVRIGILLSIVWATSAAIYTHNADVERAESFARFAYKACTFGKEVDHNADLSSCAAERTNNVRTWMNGSNANAAVAALAPLPFSWLAVFILMYVLRAQLIGFRAVVPWKTLTLPKKLVVAFCAVCSAIAIGGGIVISLNLYVDTKVPVGMSSFLDVSRTGDFVSVAGTWTRTDLTGDMIANPLQTSKIECNKAENRCTEALASVSETLLMADIVDYTIQSWTPDTVVLRRDYECATELFTIDLNTKAVTGAGHKINENDPFCNMNKEGKESWTFQLSSGFNVYWELRKRARPLPLRVIQSIFGS